MGYPPARTEFTLGTTGQEKAKWTLETADTLKSATSEVFGNPVASSPRLPVAARDRQATAGQTRSPRFRRDPSIRDVASDPGRATVPRITAPHMLPSAVATASAPAISRISWLNPTPQTITVYASPMVVTFHDATLVTGQALPPSRTGLSPAGPRQLRLAHRYAFTVRDSHPLLLAGLPAHIGLVSD